jgi:hypothetical protein
VFGDLYNVKGQLKRIDRDLNLRYEGYGRYTVTHKGKYFMRVNPGELDQRVVNHVRKMVFLNRHGLVEKDMDDKNAAIEKEQDRKLSDYAENFARDIRKPLIRQTDYGA